MPMSTVQTIGATSLYLLALINPISKVAIFLSLPEEQRHKQFRSMAAQSSLIALVILLVAMLAGEFLLRVVFRVDLHSLRFAGGVVVFWFGLNALRRGAFFEMEHDKHSENFALVPLACPMIAGPATIAASIGLKAEYQLLVVVTAMVLAIGANYVIMIMSEVIGRLLRHRNILGAIIRITGLIVMTIGTQMVFDGILGRIASGN